MATATFVHPENNDTAQRLAWKTANFLYAGLGLAGSVRVTAGAPATGKFWIFHAITDCVIAGITYSDGSNGASAGDTILAGDRVYGAISYLAISSGTGELYRASMP